MIEKKKTTILRYICLFLACTLLLGSCTSLPVNLDFHLMRGTPTPTATPDPDIVIQAFSDAEIMSAIQISLDHYARAYNENNPDFLALAVDQENLPFRRMVKNMFESYQESIFAGSYQYNFHVESIQRWGQGFVLAHITTQEGLAADWIFRFAQGSWVLAEPNLEQAGEPTRVATEHFIFETYPWNGELNDEIIQLMDNAAARVQQKLGRLPEEKALVKILPGYTIDPYSDPNAMAYFGSSGIEDMDEIIVFSPITLSFGLYDPEQGWQDVLEQILTHEYTHMAHLRAFGNAGKLMDWVDEGLAEYTCDSGRIVEVKEALSTDSLIPIIDETDTTDKQDLMHLYQLDRDVSLAYAEAESLVYFIEIQYGGIEKFWGLVQAHDEIQDFDLALQQVLGVTYAEFDRDWRDFLQFNFGS